MGFNPDSEDVIAVVFEEKVNLHARCDVDALTVLRDLLEFLKLDLVEIKDEYNQVICYQFEKQALEDVLKKKS